jgi:AraC-like DNA-binding protein
MDFPWLGLPLAWSFLLETPVDEDRRRVLGLIEQTLRITVLGGDVTPIGTHSTGWRTSPGAGCVHLVGLRTTIRLPGGVTHVAEPDSAIAYDDGHHHCLDSVEVGRGCARWAHATHHVLGGVSVLSLFDVPLVRPPPGSVAIGDACAALAAASAEPAASPVAGVVRMSALKLRLLLALIDGAPTNQRAAVLIANAQRLAPVFAAIDERLAEPASREGLARLAGLSPSRFHELFLAVMREPPMAYLARRRMLRAQQLLIGGGRSVREVAAAVGFTDPFHFSRVFKRVCGESPARYRERFARGIGSLWPPA